MEACMKRLLLAGAAALLLTGVAAGPTYAAVKGGGPGGAGGMTHMTGPGGAGGMTRGPTNFGNVNRGPGPYASVTRGPNTFTATPNRTAGHWGWLHGRRHFFPGVAAGVGLGLAFGAWGWPYYNDCVAWNGWQWVNVCGPYAYGYGPSW
jgi:hypothetical protein